jgi:hypothetical protein
MTRSRQHGKGGKRLKRWHRGKGEARRWRDIERTMPDLGTGAAPEDAAPPQVAHRGPGKRWRGEAAS